MNPIQYQKKTKHRKRCCSCNKLIQDNELVYMRRNQTEKHYPVKGIMKFNNWQFVHKCCFESDEAIRLSFEASER